MTAVMSLALPTIWSSESNAENHFPNCRVATDCGGANRILTPIKDSAPRTQKRQPTPVAHQKSPVHVLPSIVASARPLIKLNRLTPSAFIRQCGTPAVRTLLFHFPRRTARATQSVVLSYTFGRTTFFLSSRSLLTYSARHAPIAVRYPVSLARLAQYALLSSERNSSTASLLASANTARALRCAALFG